MKKQDVAGKMKKEYTGHYQEDGAGRIRHLSSKTVARNEHRFQKGKAALNIPKSKTGKNEGNKMYEGKNEQERM